MKKLNNYNLTKNFTLHEMIEGRSLPQLAIEMNWNYLVNADTQEVSRIITNLTAVAQELQTIRDDYNQPVIIFSGFRCFAWEKHRNRSGDSQHVQGLAADFNVAGKLAEIYRYYNDTNWMGGLARGFSSDGNYSFMHLDLREPSKEHRQRGYGARWVY